MKLSGRLSREFFGGDVWVLRASDGAQFQLLGEIPSGLDGKDVEVEGRLGEGEMGIAMVGDIVHVRSIRAR